MKGFELAKKMSALGPAAIMQAGRTAAKKQDSKTETRETAAIGDAPLPPAAEGYSGSDEQEKARWALGLADSMAVAAFYDIADAGMVRAAGLAVSAYPHPLLLNNYAGMIGEVSPDDALFFYFSALALEPRNPVILTNIAMSFLDREDFGAARNYAAQALSENPEFGPAFQVLTICHLRDGNSVLAAETLMKSARDCFDDLSVRLFDDYLEEVGNLDVTQGEKYPLQEDQLEILYQIAKKYGDPERENGADTPGAQIRINPFPVFGSADHYLNSGDFLLGDAERRTAKLKKISAELSRLEKAVFGRQGSRGALPVVKNMRQYYAYLVLESYYHFKMRELNWKLQEEDPTDDLLEGIRGCLHDPVHVLQEAGGRLSPCISEAAEGDSEGGGGVVPEGDPFLFCVSRPPEDPPGHHPAVYRRVPEDPEEQIRRTKAPGGGVLAEGGRTDEIHDGQGCVRPHRQQAGDVRRGLDGYLAYSGVPCPQCGRFRVRQGCGRSSPGHVAAFPVLHLPTGPPGSPGEDAAVPGRTGETEQRAQQADPAPEGPAEIRL
ncbi:tetratricopeptide repeat protein [Aminivibrio sp.]|uniref:tetratricopeptide repeat protein n=1 Tax=Aminivibrio sp. TaxID=1872489 RepID=UPI003D99CAE0